MYQPSNYFPIFGPDIPCPHCRQNIAALTLTDTYLCQRHGAFEADPQTEELVHLQSSRRWRRWQDSWYRQHTHADGIRFEIHEELDRLHAQGYRATRILVAHRYKDLLSSSLERMSWSAEDSLRLTLGGPASENSARYRLYGLPVEFSTGDPRWLVINFELYKEPGASLKERYFRNLFDH
ncbi:TIGR02652 family protein [Anthocerotibacter panamensis]|uniref:TIGR02652 family protein n=1 Tax=Anthocerotibacter panamensis TaxID=2857077 RepID=UPI001C4087EA|nr:TIGR02652 family protein [Anthocerotibacter panamensis]